MKNFQLPFLFGQQVAHRQGEDRYKALVENSIHAYFLTKPDGGILESNHVATSMFGYTGHELTGLNKKTSSTIGMKTLSWR